MRPLLRYYGGKWRLARMYPPPRYSLVVEPFAGGAGYSLYWNVRRALLIDTDEHLVRAWQWLLAATPSEVLSLPDVEPGQDIREMGLPDGVVALMSYWMQASAGARWHLSAWMRKSMADGDASCRYWNRNLRHRIARSLSGIAQWECRLGSYEDAPDIEATWFIDPPYQGPAGRHYRKHVIDYARLAEWCRSRRGQVIVCEQEGADWLPFESFMRSRGMTSDDGCSRYHTEVWWTNESQPEQLELAI